MSSCDGRGVFELNNDKKPGRRQVFYQIGDIMK